MISMNYFFAAGLSILLIPVLFAPSLLMALKLRRAGGPPARRQLLVMWPAQLAAALLLCLVAELAGSTSPMLSAGVFCVLVSLAGPAVLWLLHRRRPR